MQESPPQPPWSTAALVTSPTSLTKGGPSSELVLPPLPSLQHKSGEELVCGPASALTDRLKDIDLSWSSWSEVGEEKRAGMGRGGQQGLPTCVTESFEPHLEVSSEVGPKTGVPETGHTHHTAECVLH